ncbi:hypothetical protein OTB20_19490 [Streptomyces sp. H27-H1]|uniref:hypothetical protein n=1 Tax=Streptomyces sp. H27-H1 TaxID=2996461 RepID=UPI002271D870|nr:hypothetical protein [Streptomyces sp. H27-H1]MCY0928341.1 hypothetical protein [Streptomyces sp. H27-H1]
MNSLCCICTSTLWDDEAGRTICRPCERRIAENLLALSGPGGLYARLCLRIHPSGSASSGPAVSGTRGAPIPANLQILDLTANGGLVTTLEQWVEDWASYGLAQVGIGGRLQYRVDRAVATLRLNLPQAASRHPALDEAAREFWSIRRQCEALIAGGRPPIKIPVKCPCGSTIKTNIDTHGETCPGCDTQYGKAEVLQLPMIERTAA